MEARHLAGSEKLFQSFVDKFQRRTRSAYKSLFVAIEDARRKERRQYGETVYLLEPNIKRARAAACATFNYCAGWVSPVTGRPIPRPCSCWGASPRKISGRA